MSALAIRDLIPFPGGAAGNSSDTILDGVHFNLTTLTHFNYTLFTNGTLSNGSKCYMAVEPWTPDYLFVNGSFVNSTSCYSPVDDIGSRAAVGIAFAVTFAICLIGVLVNLTKHGRLHLPAEKRFTPVGRRWQWYWSAWVIVTAFISLFTNIDVDRFRVMGLPIILNSFFWYLMQQGAMALVWEAVRHWGSWQERQYIDPNPFILSDDDTRSKVAFWQPLFFYLWLWLNFFLIVPRNWNRIQEQRTAEQAAVRAIPAATDARFKAASFFLLLCWLTIFASLRHSIKHYKPRNRGIINRVRGFWRYTPMRFRLVLPISLILVAYQILASFSWANSVLNANGNLGAIYAGGYGPALVILFIQVAWGFLTPNEDLELRRQRRQRGDDMDRQMGIVRKPAWWRRVNAAMHINSKGDSNIGGGRPTGRGVHANFDAQAHDDENQPIEMGVVQASRQQHGSLDASKMSTLATTYEGKSDRRRHERAMNAAGGLLFPNAEAQASDSQAQTERRANAMRDGPAPPPYTDRTLSIHQRTGSGQSPVDSAATRGTVTPPNATVGSARPQTNERSRSTSTNASSAGQPQQIRSMLDV